MPKTYSIAWRIDDSQAAAALKRGVKDLAGVERAALNTAKAAEAAFAKVTAAAAASGTAQSNASAATANAQIALVNRVTGAAKAANQAQAASGAKLNQQIVSGLQAASQVQTVTLGQLQNSAKQATDAILASLGKQAVGLSTVQMSGIKLQESQIKAAEKTKKELSSIEDRYLMQDYSRKVQHERQKEAAEMGPLARLSNFKRRAMTEEQVQAAAANKAMEALNKQRVNAAMEAMGVETDSYSKGIAGAFGLEAAITKAGAAMMGLGAAKATVGAITGAFVEAKLRSEEMARQVLDTSQDLREIAAIKEKFAPDEEELAQHMKVRVGSGMTHEQAVGYQENLLNALGTVSKDKLSDKERENLEVEGAKFVARTSRNAATASAKAATLGMLPNFMKPAPGKELKALDVTNMGDAIDVILGRGMGSAETMATNYQDVLSALSSEDDMKGFFRDPRQSAALTSIASGFDKGAPGTATLQAVRQLRSFTKFRKKKGANAAQTQTLTAMGISEADDPQQAMMKMFKYADNNFGDEAFDAALQRRGFGDETGNKRLAQFYGQYKKGTFKELTDLAAAPIVPGAVDEKNAAFARSKVGRDLISKAKVDAAKLKRGAGDVDLTVAKQEAEAQLIEEGADDNPWNIAKRGVVGWFSALGGEKSRIDVRDAEIEQRALANVRKRAGKATAGGVGEIGRRVDTTLLGQIPFNPLAAVPYFAGVGGVAQSIFGHKESADEVAKLTKAVDKLSDAADALKKAQPGMQAQPPVGGAPNGQPLR